MNPCDGGPRTAEETYRALESLPPFPGIVTKLLRLLSHDESQVNEIVILLRADAGLASELLRVVNSPVFGFPSRISSIQNAVTLMGFDRVKGFALTVSMKAFFHAALRLDVLRGIWRHSLASAIVCEELSTVCSTSQARDDRAYTAGLLHDVGRMGLFVAHPQEYTVLLEEPQTTDILDRERHAFGMDHCEAGSWLAEHWDLPGEVQRVITSHHQPPGAERFELGDLVRVGVLLTEALGFDVIRPVHPYTLSDVRSMLPHAAQYRFDPDPTVMTAKITAQLDSFD